MSPKKNYGSENSDSCSLMSVTGLNTNSFNSEHKSKSSSSSSSSSCSKCQSSSESSYSTESSSDKNTNSCTEVTYTDKSSESSSSEEESSICKNPCSISSDKCEPICKKDCTKLVKKYNCSKIELLAIKDILLILNFLANKIKAVQPNVFIRDVSNYTVVENIAWLESFIDTLFCVLRKNEAYKIIKVTECKLKNDSDCQLYVNRTYLIKVQYKSKEGPQCRIIKLDLQWSQLTNNTAKAYNNVLDYSISDLNKQITGYEAASTIPFLG